jgi:ATP-binding cassette subfamily F protein 3
VKPYDGDMADYRQLVTGVAPGRREKREADKASKADRRREAAQRRAQLEPLAKQIKTTEALIERLRKRVAAIEAQLADPTLYEGDGGKASALSKERAELSGKIARQEDLWLSLSSEYEEASAA